MKNMILLYIFITCRGASAADFVQQHHYIPGETLHYLFEDTESTYEGTSNGNVIEPGRLTRYQELIIPLEIRIGKDRKLVFGNATYRSADPTLFNATPPDLLTHLIPKFPKRFFYSYITDGQAIREVIGPAYSPYRENEVADFVFYKAMDIHTIQSVIDDLPVTLKVGQTLIKPAVDIPLPDGIFHNGETIVHFVRIEKIDGVRCAFFKVVTMGNTYRQHQNNRVSFTNYQYSFDVPLEGHYQGLLYRGELQETVVAPPSFLLQRQLSMRIKRN